ncbi:histone methylase [Cryptosporidium ubiquitum]|uniref:Protein arginine N-methyltransferase n=1 Tax=Cryptosporidium ubiquitum TaxID=857276 RepID=A0A1J4MPJ1_9CRYT|nr:histone methylase [Cryptosporidium ubiquitum]OII74900.1 histone methylase [Cryptosporidium ubiquitum]
MPIRIFPEIFNIGLNLSEDDLNNYDNSYFEPGFKKVSDSKKLKRALNDLKDIGYDFVCVPVSQNSESKNNITNGFNLELKFLEHYEIGGSDWNAGIIGKFPTDGHLNLNEAKKLLNWCDYVGYHAVIISIEQLSIHFLSVISSFIGLISTRIQIWIEVIINNGNSIDKQWNEWQVANTIISSSANAKIGLVLKIDSSSYRNIKADDYSRFFGEPVKCLFINSDFFESSHSNILISELLMGSMRAKIPVSIYLNENENSNIELIIKKSFKNIINFIKSFPPLSDQQKYEYNYIDILQTPLQPLWNDLKSIEYEVFEKDSMKYEKYFHAVKLFLSEHPLALEEIKVLIVGSGRGGLIQSVLNAFNCLCNDSFKILCVEKNRNAVVTLRAKINYEENANWKKVEVINSDIREIELSEKYDLIVSELMGSFGDNELSPECLIYAQKFMKPNGKMIPQRYTSYLEPISCRKVWNNAVSYSKSKNLEIPFVSRLRSHYKISTEGPKKVFSFNHPAEFIQEEKDNTIFASIDFTSKADSVLHGFLGYFECNLYNEIGFSTLPSDFTIGLISWFDFFIPISSPILLRKFDNITFNIWRKSNKEKVWYEWLVTKPTTSFIHNLNGRMYSIHL